MNARRLHLSSRWVPAGRLLAGVLLSALLLVLAPGGAERRSSVHASGARSYPAYYLILERGPQGDVRLLASRLVRLSAPLDSLDDRALAARMEQPGRDVVRYAVRLEDGSGQALYQNVVEAPRWLRAEFHGAEFHGAGAGAAIDGQVLPLERAVFVARVPVLADKRLLRGAQLALQVGAQGPAAHFELERLALSSTEIDLEAVGQAALLADNGPPGNRVDLLVVGDGYTLAQQDRFDAHAQETVAEFLSISPYRDYRNYVNVHSLFVPSAQAGADHPPFRQDCNEASCCGDPDMLSDPLQGTMVDTAFDARYCAYNIHRLLMVDAYQVALAAAAVPDWDQILVIVNDTTYGGSGGQNAVISMHDLAPQIAQHEYGHSFAGLADEYETPYPGYPRCSDWGGPACEPNVTNVAARARVKWGPWIAPSVPVPTEPEFDPAFVDVVGLFEGARYRSTGMYRPGQNCIMRALGAPYCAVPSQTYVLKLYNGGWGTPSGGIRLIEPGSLWPEIGTLSLTLDDSQAFRAHTLGPAGGPPVEVRWTVDGSTVLTQTETFTYTPAYTDVGRSVEIGLYVQDRTPLVHPEMAGGALSESTAWTVRVEGVALASVSIAGPAAVVVDQANVFTATATPQAGTGPVVYSWSPQPEAGQGTPQATYRWHTAGPQTISVTATGVMGGMVSDTHTVEVKAVAQQWRYFFPLVYRGAGP